jgi:hypothetical protein
MEQYNRVEKLEERVENLEKLKIERKAKRYKVISKKDINVNGKKRKMGLSFIENDSQELRNLEANNYIKCVGF